MPWLVCLLLTAPRSADATRLASTSGLVQKSRHLQGANLQVQPLKSQQLVRSSDVKSRGNSSDVEKQDGTACTCVCGNRVVWRRELFAGNVKDFKEHECEHDICPYVNIPGLRVIAECTYVKDIRQLTAGTICICQCGDKAAWHNRGFYGNVVEQKERECLQEVCPRVNPVPGYRFTADCRFDPNLFRMHPARPTHAPQHPPQQRDPYGASWQPRTGSLVVILLAAVSST